jgi:hypothetical protein
MDFQIEETSHGTSTDRYIYQFRYVLTNAVGDQQVVKSSLFDNPYKMSITLLQSYRFLEKRILADIALVRRPTPDFLLDLIKLRLAIGVARELITRICTEPEFPGQITEGFTILDFTPEPGSVPLRGARMEIHVKSIPETATGYDLLHTNSSSPQRNHFTPVEYKFINKYMRFLRAPPSFPQF